MSTKQISSKAETWRALQALALEAAPLRISELVTDKSRLKKLTVSLNVIDVDFSKHLLTDEILTQLLTLAEASQVVAQAKQMVAGHIVNNSEKRAASHTAMRLPLASIPSDMVDHVKSERSKLQAVSNEIRDGTYVGVTGARITDIINIGIGGSDLGPKMVYEALRQYRDGPDVHFISNVDGAELQTLLAGLSAASTVVLISSKSFSTPETMLNASTAVAWLAKNLEIEAAESSPHCIAITANREAAIKLGIADSRIFTFMPSIGGRYSVWSSIGLPICISIGYENFLELLAGGAEADQHFIDAAPEENIPLLMGLIGVWYNNFLKLNTHAVIPYCQRLRLFVDHLQQLDMESNGKTASTQGIPVDHETGPIVWGQTGTNGQHAFFQLLHQGQTIVPVDFIGVTTDELSPSEHHRMLLANMIAQSEALMNGQNSDDHHRHYEGNKPSTTFLLQTLSPRSLGTLLALYEHKVFVQACIWDINPFDQWGVELGKQLATDILAGHGDHDPSTTQLLKKTGLID
jgi:glucose-6-phosphate isomerase